MPLNISDFLDERIEEIYSHMRTTIPEYARAFQQRKELFGIIDDLMSDEHSGTLTENERHRLKEYMERDFIATSIEQQQFYRNGYWDCVELLKYLKIL